MPLTFTDRVAAAAQIYQSYSPGGAYADPSIFNAWFLLPTRVTLPNGISIGSSVFAGLTGVPSTQTHRRADNRPRATRVGR